MVKGNNVRKRLACWKGRPAHRWFGLLAGAVFSLGVAAQDAGPALNPDVPLEYTVKKGDTLWDISSYYLQSPWLWPELWQANPQVENPHLIYPGEVLYLVWVDGRPRLTRDPPGMTGGLVRLSPEARATPLRPAIPTIPLDAIRSFLNGPRVIDIDTYEKAPYIVGFEDQRLLGSSGIEAYLRRVTREEGFRYNLVRLGDTYHDPDTDELLGYEAIPIGRLEIQDFAPVSRGNIQTSFREAREGDRLLRLSAADYVSNFYPHAPEAVVDGQIISVFDGVSHIGQYQIVTLNVGARDGLEPGHILRVIQRGAVVDDPEFDAYNTEVAARRPYDRRPRKAPAGAVLPGKLQLPDRNAGLLMIFKTFKGISYGLIMRATRSIHIRDKVGNPLPTG